MKRVALLVTGDVEKRALHLSLKRIFPDVEFEPQQLDGFTSGELPVEPPAFDAGNPSLVDKLAAALVSAVDPGRSGTPADLAFLVDDFKLWNTRVPERAVHHIRVAVARQLEHRWPSSDRRRRSADLVRDRCSFHLLSPMVEAYFFGEPEALARAGATRPAQVDPSVTDIEDFLVADDAEFLAPPDGKHPIWAKAHRARHPKCYVQFLCDPAGANPRAYRETKGGHEALRSLDWRAVLAPPSHVRFAAALSWPISPKRSTVRRPPRCSRACLTGSPCGTTATMCSATSEHPGHARSLVGHARARRLSPARARPPRSRRPGQCVERSQQPVVRSRAGGHAGRERQRSP